jgi:hypothetical protein
MPGPSEAVEHPRLVFEGRKAIAVAERHGDDGATPSEGFLSGFLTLRGRQPNAVHVRAGRPQALEDQTK